MELERAFTGTEPIHNVHTQYFYCFSCIDENVSAHLLLLRSGTKKDRPQPIKVGLRY